MTSHAIRLLLALLLVFPSLLVTVRAHACSTVCDDASGVVNLPAGADISLPFAKGEKVLVTSGYGPNGGSGWHCQSQDTVCANDYFALDLVLPGYANNGKGQPVLAAAGGTVIDAAWGTQGWSSYGMRVYVQHDFGDGHKYTTMYAHLDSIKVTKGQKLNKGDPVGTLGHSSEGIQANPGVGPHVHFSVHRDPGFGGTGSGGSYGGRAVRPEPIDGYKNLAKGQTLTSNNGGGTPPPPTTCDIVIQPTGDTIIEDESPCAAKQGTLGESTSGMGGHAYTATLDVPDPDYAEGVVWNLTFAQAGTYDVSAWIPNGISNLTPEAVYKTQFDGGSAKVTVDQAGNAGGWALIGTYGFAAGGQQWVRLGDNYLSAASQGKTFVIDALKISPGAASTDGGVGGAGVGGSSGASGTGGWGWPDSGSGGISQVGGSGGTGAGGNDATTPAADDGGCGCRTPTRSSSRGLLVLALGALGVGLLRRRARGRSE